MAGLSAFAFASSINNAAVYLNKNKNILNHNLFETIDLIDIIFTTRELYFKIEHSGM